MSNAFDRVERTPPSAAFAAVLAFDFDPDFDLRPAVQPHRAAATPALSPGLDLRTSP